MQTYAQGSRREIKRISEKLRINAELLNMPIARIALSIFYLSTIWSLNTHPTPKLVLVNRKKSTKSETEYAIESITNRTRVRLTKSLKCDIGVRLQRRRRELRCLGAIWTFKRLCSHLSLAPSHRKHTYPLTPSKSQLQCSTPKSFT